MLINSRKSDTQGLEELKTKLCSNSSWTRSHILEHWRVIHIIVKGCPAVLLQNLKYGDRDSFAAVASILQLLTPLSGLSWPEIREPFHILMGFLFCFWWSTWLLPLGSALRRVIRWHFLEQNPKNLNLRSQIQQCSSQEHLLNQYPSLPAGVLCPGCTLELPGCFNKILWTRPYLRPIKSECPQGGTRHQYFQNVLQVILMWEPFTV